MSQPPNVNLNDLRIEEPSPGSGGRKLVIAFTVVLILASFGLGWFLQSLIRGGGTLGGAIPVRIETVRVGGGTPPSADGLGEGGWIEVPSHHPIIVSALVGGRVEDLLVLEGSSVQKNDVIARLYAKDFADVLRKSEAAVNEAQADLDLLTAGYRSEDIEKARADTTRLDEEAKLAEKVLARTRKLVPTGAASAEELERDASALEVARSRLAAARQELARFEAGFRKEEIAKARASLTRAGAERDLAKARLSYCEVRSPATGIVLQRHVTPGTFLAASNPRIVSLYDPGDLQVRVDVRQENASRVHVGQKVDIRTEAEADVTYHGTVIRIEPLADFKKNTVQAKVRIEDPSPALHPEMICRVRFLREKDATTGQSEKTRMTIASSAVLREEGRSFVYKVADGRAVRTEVRTGAVQGGRVTVESGLAAGDKIVVAPSPDLSDGATVEVTGR